MIECPICKQKLNALNKHIIWKHNMSIEEFKKQYNVTKLQENCRKDNLNLKCPYCNDVFRLNNQLSIHIKFHHKDKWEEMQKELNKSKNQNQHLTCKICEFKTNLLYYHIKCSHKDITWEEYCKNYNHDLNIKAYFSEEHKNNLSINKKKFYASEKGLQERKKQSIKFQGDNNPAKSPEVRKKISDAAIKKTLNNDNNFMINSYGIKFKFIFNNKTYHTRSFEEFKVIYTLLKNNISFEYEKIFLNYKLNDVLHKYILDLKIGDMYIEIKSNTTKCNYYDIPKYKSIEDMLLKINKHLYILTYKEICDKLNIKPIMNVFLYKDIKKMLDNDQCFISKYVCSGKQINSRILQSIDSDYKNNKNIKYIYKEVKNDQI